MEEKGGGGGTKAIYSWNMNEIRFHCDFSKKGKKIFLL